MSRTALFALFALILTLSTPAFAEIEIRECGKPPEAKLNTDPGGTYCDIYSRQLAYGEEEAKFRELMIERQKNFAAPSIKASQQYRENVRTLHGYESEYTQEVEEKDEQFGPNFNQ